MKFLDALDEARREIRLLRIIIFGLMGLCALLIFGWAHNQNNIRVHIPPMIPQSGLTLTQGEVPKSTVYSFAFYIWQGVNHWSNDGYKDYKTQIMAFSPYLTEEFQEQLVDNYNELLGEGELQDRTRVLQPLDQSVYQEQDVQQVDKNTWLVHLPFRLVESIHADGKVVKDVEMDYVLKIISYNIDANTNPYGLALAGFAAEPQRIKTII